ncbi:MAG: isocitrate lyase/phosphoenolpyruvate mutase family protein [Chitinophagaceae bacterium]|nr:isocitrate lyase/phosphoenolpyruvate mutase family protein [Chitinophagaceae bacterium]
MNTLSQHKKGEALEALHQRSGVFVIANAWDAGSARGLTAMGFEAIATTSAGLANSKGKPDGEGVLTREETFGNVAEIIHATSLPVSADLENGYGDDPEDCYATILEGAALGLVGGSIEDATGSPGDPIYEFKHAVERVRAAVKAARSLPFTFTLTARAENLIHGRPDLKDTINRLVAYAEAGADVLFAPGLSSREDIEAVVRAVAPKPVNVVVGLGITGFSLKDFEAMGVKRISLGSSLARAAFTGFYQAAEEIRQSGTFGYNAASLSYGKINDMMR